MVLQLQATFRYCCKAGNFIRFRRNCCLVLTKGWRQKLKAKLITSRRYRSLIANCCWSCQLPAPLAAIPMLHAAFASVHRGMFDGSSPLSLSVNSQKAFSCMWFNVAKRKTLFPIVDGLSKLKNFLPFRAFQNSGMLFTINQPHCPAKRLWFSEPF